MFALILAVVFSGNSEDRLPEIPLSFNVPKISFVRDSMKLIPPKKVGWNDMNKLDAGKMKIVEKPNPDHFIVMDNWY